MYFYELFKAMVKIDKNIWKYYNWINKKVECKFIDVKLKGHMKDYI